MTEGQQRKGELSIVPLANEKQKFNKHAKPFSVTYRLTFSGVLMLFLSSV